MSDTPMTDNVTLQGSLAVKDGWYAESQSGWVKAEYAQNLERALTAERSKNAKLREEVAADSHHYIILNRPGMVPERKGPYDDPEWMERSIQECYTIYPDCTCTVIFAPSDCWPESGKEWLVRAMKEKK